jgi:hypothetical protein
MVYKQAWSIKNYRCVWDVSLVNIKMTHENYFDANTRSSNYAAEEKGWSSL